MDLQKQLQPIKEKLQKAIELELATLPPYLTALFSIHPGANAAAAALIRSVAMEEMLHLLLAANVLTSIGGSVKLGRDQVPRYPLRLQFKGDEFKDRQFDVHLAAFSQDTIGVFRQIELPQNWETTLELNHITVPGFTVGEFYRSIVAELRAVCAAFGEPTVFCGNRAHQVSPEFYWRGGGRPVVVTSLAEAEAALNLIVEQGEGTSADAATELFAQNNKAEVPHYFRFSEIFYNRFYNQNDDPRQEPTGAEMGVDYSAVFPLKTDCTSADLVNFPELAYLNNLFNTNYSNMLAQLEEGFNGNPSLLYTAILDSMRQLTSIALNLVQLPVPHDAQGRHAAPTFEWNQV